MLGVVCSTGVVDTVWCVGCQIEQVEHPLLAVQRTLMLGEEAGSVEDSILPC
jgi:hypothetical protein